MDLKKPEILRRWRSIISVGTLALFFGLGLGQSGYADDSPLPSFGKGKIEVRLFTDYFCPPCRAMEPKIEPLLTELMKKGTVTVIFVDTPTSPYTSLFARYFINALASNQDFESILYVRNTLFEAAEHHITEKAKLEDFLKARNIETKAADTSAVFSFWNKILKEDDIRSTPTCVIINGDKKEKFVGSMEIPKALEALKKGSASEEGIAKNVAGAGKK
jgi:thiol-disulfide isomerase/thioredoxin